MGTTIRLIQRIDKVNRKGLAPILLRLTENRKSRFISTGVSIPISDWDSKNQCIRPTSNYAEYQFTLDRVKQEQFRGVVLEDARTIERSRASIKQTIEERFEHEIQTLVGQGKIGTAVKYKGCASLLSQAGLLSIRISSIDRSFLDTFLQFLIKKGNKSNSIATKFSVLRAVWNKAKADGIRMPEQDPFLQFHVGKFWTATKKRSLTKEEVLIVRGCQLDFDPSPSSVSFARDIFVFAYLEGGLNFGDIAFLKETNISRERIYYVRRKTQKEISIHLADEASNIIARYRQDKSDPDQYLFPILNRHLHRSDQQIFNRIHKVLGIVNKNLHQLGEDLHLSLCLTTYVARHSFATVLKRSGVSVEVISECLGHADIQTTQIYLDSFSDNEKDKALENLL